STAEERLFLLTGFFIFLFLRFSAIRQVVTQNVISEREIVNMEARILTRRAMLLSSLRVPQSDVELIIRAATIEGISRSEFLRKSLRERGKRVVQKARTKEWR